MHELTSSERLVHELTVAADASIGVVAIRCAETEVYRVVDDLYTLAMNLKTGFTIHTAETGWADYARIDPDDVNAPAFDPLEPQDTNRDSADVAGAFEHLWNDATAKTGFFVMLDMYHYFDSVAAQTRLRKQVQRALSVDQQIFLVVPVSADIPETLTPLMHIIELGYPTTKELSQSLDDILDNIDAAYRPGSIEGISDDGKVMRSLSAEERSGIIANGQGMTASAFETALALSITEHGEEFSSMEGFSAEYITNIMRTYKTKLLKKTNVLELQQPVSEEDVGGLDLFKGWMRQRKATYTEEAKEAHVTPSRGVMVIGPPGTGKSLLAKAAGSILNLPVIRFDVGRVFNAYIGTSEQTMRSVLAQIDATSPCVLMLDEIDKGFSGMSGGSNDSGTTARVFGTFLTWMQERDQMNRPVFLIATANRIHGLPPELLRKGRIDEIFSVNMPNETEREEIVKIHLRKRKQAIPRKSDKAAITRITEGLVGAEIESLIEDALVMSLDSGEAKVTFELIEQASSYLKPMAKTREAEFSEMRKWADENARPASTSPLQLQRTKPLQRKRSLRGRRQSIKE
jgi:ATP-dependent 26S proteasome regulatory subunit